jgi:hypothetical protein
MISPISGIPASAKEMTFARNMVQLIELLLFDIYLYNITIFPVNQQFLMLDLLHSDTHLLLFHKIRNKVMEEVHPEAIR